MPIAQIDALTAVWKTKLTTVETREGELVTARAAVVMAMNNLASARSQEQVAHKNLLSVRLGVYGASDPDQQGR